MQLLRQFSGDTSDGNSQPEKGRSARGRGHYTASIDDYISDRALLFTLFVSFCFYGLLLVASFLQSTIDELSSLDFESMPANEAHALIACYMRHE